MNPFAKIWYPKGLWILQIFLVMLPLCTLSQNSEKPDKFVLNGYIKDMQSFFFQDLKQNLVAANLVHNRLNFKWFISSGFTASVEMRNRFLAGNIFAAYPGFGSSFDEDPGISKLSVNLIDQKSILLNSSVDRLWLQYSIDKLHVTAGRQRINWGQTFVWNPNDIFNTYSWFDFDYEEKPGSDAIRIQYFSGPASVLEFALKLNQRKEATIAGLYRFNKWNYDFQMIGGIYNKNDFVIGTGWSGQILNGGFRGEATWFHPVRRSNQEGVFIADIGYDYTFKNSLFLQLETLYNGNNSNSWESMINPLFSFTMNSKDLFLPDFSQFISLSCPFTPLLTGSLAAIENPKFGLLFIIPALTISIVENLELSFTSQLMRYSGDQADSQNLNLFFARLKYNF